MARPRKKADDLVPEESPLEELSDAEESVDAPAAEGSAPAAGEPAAEEAAADAPAEEPVAEEPPAADAVVEEAPAEDTASEEPPVEEAAAETPPAEAPAAESGEPVEEAPAEEPAAEVEEPGSEEPAAEAADGAPVAEEPATPEEPAKPAVPAKPRKTRAERKARVRTKRRGSATSGGERKPIVRLPKPEHERGRRKERRGVVVSSAMDKTIVVRVDTAKPDRRYKKVVRRSTKFHAHDERNEAKVGDVVRIVETRPLSKTKTWRLVEVVEVAQ